jgi:hypothetical protein
MQAGVALIFVGEADVVFKNITTGSLSTVETTLLKLYHCIFCSRSVLLATELSLAGCCAVSTLSAICSASRQAGVATYES